MDLTLPNTEQEAVEVSAIDESDFDPFLALPCQDGQPDFGSIPALNVQDAFMSLPKSSYFTTGSPYDRLIGLNGFDISCWELRPDTVLFEEDDFNSADIAPQQKLQDFDEFENVLHTGNIESEETKRYRNEAYLETQRDLNDVGNINIETELHHPTSSLLCSVCQRMFGARKSLLRHVRTVHQPKLFSCSRCHIKFSRKDTMTRHENEKHFNPDNSIKCLGCGRYMSKRAFAEHRDSDVCREASALANPPLEDRNTSFVGAEDDPFLAALQMLRLFEPDTGSKTIAYVRLKLQHRNFLDVSTKLHCEGRIARLMLERLKNSKIPSRSLAMAALLSGFMEMAGKKAWD